LTPKILNIACATIISIGLSINSMIGHAAAQTTSQAPTETEETTPTAETPTAEAPPNDPKANETTEETEAAAKDKKLDILLLGPWAKLSDSVYAPITKGLVRNGSVQCRSFMNLTRLRVSPEELETLRGKSKELVGDVFYYRTKEGIQRLDNKTNTLLTITEADVPNRRDGKEVWLLKGERIRFNVLFNTKVNNGKSYDFLASNDGLYLRCIRRPTPTE